MDVMEARGVRRFLRRSAGRLRKQVNQTTAKGGLEKVVAYVRSDIGYDIASRRQFHYTYRPVGKHLAHRFIIAQLQKP